MFKKWDIIYISKFPESIQCSSSDCRRHFSPSKSSCPYCGSENMISNLIAKIRPIILWLDNDYWIESMAFGIPLSSNKIYSNKHNQKILLTDYVFSHKDSRYERPMRALIHQATRIDGCVLSKSKIIGTITNSVVKDEIENKLFEWIFPLRKES